VYESFADKSYGKTLIRAKDAYKNLNRLHWRLPAVSEALKGK
jgi:hypothetical protein